VRNARALIASLGAGGSLVAAGACVLLVVSTIVAFRGWPDLADADEAPGALRIAGALPGGGGDAEADAAARRIELPRGGAARTAAARDGRGARGRRDGRGLPAGDGAAPGRDGGGVAIPAGDPAPVAGGGPAAGGGSHGGGGAPAASNPGTPGPATPSLAQVRPPAETVQETAGDAGDSVGEAGQEIADTVAPVAPETGQAVQQVSDAAGATVEQVGDAVGGLLGGG
jgi:hypothetical protein